MDPSITGKTAFVSGSTAGIGFAIARGLLEQGAAVWINGRTDERVERALTSLREAVPGGEVRGVAADLGAPAGAERIIAALPTADILVNNLGIYEWKPFDEISDEDWERFFAVNVMSGVRLTRHYVRELRERNWGRVIFVSSESGISIPVETVHYGMTKTAQLAISRGVAEAFAGTGVTVNAVPPGPTLSEGVAAMGESLAKVTSIRLRSRP